MTAKIIVTTHPKGGVGKTTINSLIAGTLASRGFRTLVADCDRQASAISWAAAAPDKAPFPAAVVSLASFEGKIHREVQRQLNNYDFIFLDTPPAIDSVAPQAALIFADLCIIPLPLAPMDVWAFVNFQKLVQASQEVNPGLQVRILPNKVERTCLSKSFSRQIGTFGIPVMRSSFGNRVAFQEAAAAGCVITKLGRSAHAASEEVKKVTDEVLEILGGKK